MEEYLRQTVEKLNSDGYGKLTIVLGNESCDLDSAVSAVVYAAFLNWQYSQIKCKVCTRTSRDEATYQDDIFVPVLNANRDDFPLKTEVVQCFREHGIDDSLLIFRNDFDFQRLSTFANTSVVLVDHHVLAKRDRVFATMVTEIIDHRQIDRSNWNYKEDTRSRIEQVGSCCSLITQRIRDVSVLMARQGDFFEAYPTATDLLLSGIILDTVNFSTTVKKATLVDEESARFLEEVLKDEYKIESRQEKLDRMLAARKDVSGLTPKQILRKDVKITGDVLVPSFPILVEEFFGMPDALSAVQESLAQNSCSFALLLGMSLVKGLERDGALVPAEGNEAKQAKFMSFLQQWKTPHFQIQVQETDDESSNNYTYFKQLNISASRKQYMIVITEFVNNSVKIL